MVVAWLISAIVASALLIALALLAHSIIDDLDNDSAPYETELYDYEGETE